VECGSRRGHADSEISTDLTLNSGVIMYLQFRLLTIVAAVGLIACGKKPEPEAPAPQPTPTANQPAPTPPSEDAAAKAAREQAERDRLAREAAEKAAAERATTLQQLVAMIHFDFDKADILSDDVSNLDRKAAIMQANSGVRLRVSGHADERGSDEYNLALGNRRAGAAKRQLVNKGIDAGRIEVISFGEERPLDPGHDEGAWAKNRRDEFEVTAGGESLVPPQ
jgi:peptidoglycan-associated lipoprotein